MKKKKNKTKLVIRIVERDNKARKGLYIYIRDPKTKEKGEYKWDGISLINEYIDYFDANRKLRKETGKRKKINRRKFHQELEKYIQKTDDKKTRQTLKKWKVKTRKYRKISTAFKKGMTTTTKNLTQMEKNPMQAYKELFTPLVAGGDKELVKILAQNANKLKHRLFYRINIDGINPITGKEETIGKITDTNKTIEHLANTYNKRFYKGLIIGSNYIMQQKPYLRFIWSEQTDTAWFTKATAKIEFRKG